MIGLSNCRRETHIFEGSPFTEAAAQTLSVRFICWKTWPQILVPGGQMLLFLCGAPIPFLGAVCRHLCSVTRANCHQEFSLRGIFMLLCRRSCADLSFPNVKKEQQFQAFRNFRCLRWVCFCLCHVLGLWRD